jgi:hypothetical protein
VPSFADEYYYNVMGTSACLISRSDVLSKGRETIRVEARSLFCYLAAHDLGNSVTDLTRLLGMAPSSVSYAVTRGKRIAEEKGLHSDPEGDIA